MLLFHCLLIDSVFSPILHVIVCIFQARLAFGNRLVSSTLVITADKTESFYSTKAAAWSLDHFMHTVSGYVENLRVSFVTAFQTTGVSLANYRC